MVGVIDGFRWALLGGESVLYWPGFLTSILLTAIFFIAGLLYFRKTETSVRGRDLRTRRSAVRDQKSAIGQHLEVRRQRSEGQRTESSKGSRSQAIRWQI